MNGISCDSAVQNERETGGRREGELDRVRAKMAEQTANTAREEGEKLGREALVIMNGSKMNDRSGQKV